MHQPAAHLPVLLYHRIVNPGMPVGKHKLHVWAHNFNRQMQWLHKNNFQTLTFGDLKHGAVQDGQRQIILTFDDGYEDNYNVMFPILKQYGFKAVIFLVTACRQNDWSIAQGQPPLNLLTVQQIKEMDAYGIEFGGHTRHHVDLKNADNQIQQTEITGCYNDLESMLQKKPLSFAYPYGAYNNDTLQLTRAAGFEYAVTTIFGPHDYKDDQLRIRRLEIRPQSGMFSFKRKAGGRYFTAGLLSHLFNT